MKERVKHHYLMDWDIKCHFLIHCTVKTFYTGTLYNRNILYNVSSICKNVPVKLKFEFITTEIQFNVILFRVKHCRSKEG